MLIYFFLLKLKPSEALRLRRHYPCMFLRATCHMEVGFIQMINDRVDHHLRTGREFSILPACSLSLPESPDPLYNGLIRELSPGDATA